MLLFLKKGKVSALSTYLSLRANGGKVKRHGLPQSKRRHLREINSLGLSNDHPNGWTFLKSTKTISIESGRASARMVSVPASTFSDHRSLRKFCRGVQFTSAARRQSANGHRTAKGPQLSIGYLSVWCGVSERTVSRHKKSGFVAFERNRAVVATGTAQDISAWREHLMTPAHSIKKWADGSFLLIEEIPSSLTSGIPMRKKRFKLSELERDIARNSFKQFSPSMFYNFKKPRHKEMLPISSMTKPEHNF